MKHGNKIHGRCALKVTGQVLRIEYRGAFNEEGYNAMLGEMRPLISPLLSATWGTIDDISDWKLSVDAIVDWVRDAVQKSVALNRRYIAVVDTNNSFSRHVFHRYVENIEGLESAFFDSIEDAEQWYRDLGLDLGNETAKDEEPVVVGLKPRKG